MYKLTCFALALCLGIVENSPYCNNWCSNNWGYGLSYACCDFNWNVQNCDPCNQQLYCPVISACSSIESTKTCLSDDDCLRKEVCCDNPCPSVPEGGRKMCMVGIKTKPVENKCPTIQDCKIWQNETAETTIKNCDDDNDCLRKESCCNNPCKGMKTCLLSKD